MQHFFYVPTFQTSTIPEDNNHYFPRGFWPPPRVGINAHRFLVFLDPIPKDPYKFVWITKYFSLMYFLSFFFG
jgi:hypothetical protein